MFEHFYLTGIGIAGYVTFCVPLAMFLTWLIHRYGLRRFASFGLRSVVTFLIASLLLSLPLWDVFVISLEADKLCREQAGLKVYRTVEAEGFLGTGGIEYWSRHSFKYVESGGTLNRRFRETMQGGKPTVFEVSEYISRYYSKTGDDHVVIGKHFARSSHQVVDRQTQAVLGELVTISIYPGWLDSLFVGLTGTGSGLHLGVCGNEAPAGRKDRLSVEDVVLATIKPERGISK